MKRLLFFIGLIFSTKSFAQTWNINVLTDSISITGVYQDAREIEFSNRQNRYSEPVKKMGLHFRNGLVNQMDNKIRIANLFGSPIIGAHGQGTEVRYGGSFGSDGGQSLPSLVALSGGKIVFQPEAKIDLVLPGSFFTRQFWILGDGTGTIEFAPGFIADRTNGGQVDSGLGSIRLSNCRLITHESQGLPLGYRPNPSMINAHLVFENEAGSRWITRTNPQEYKGGLWIRKSMSLETETDLTISGVRSVWSDYTNYGGVFMEDTNLVLTKEGQGKFIISGEQAYARGSTFQIRSGKVEFRTNPYIASDSVFYVQGNRPSGQNLNIDLSQTGKVAFLATESHIRSLKMLSSQNELEISTQTSLIAKTLIFNGIFSLIPHPGFSPALGDSLSIFKWQSKTGIFSQLVLPSLPQTLAWDTSDFYSSGTLRIAQQTSTKAVFQDQLPVVFFHPGFNELQFSEAISWFRVYDITGKVICKSDDNSSKNHFSLPFLSPGIYSVLGESRNGKLLKYKFLK